MHGNAKFPTTAEARRALHAPDKRAAANFIDNAGAEIARLNDRAGRYPDALAALEYAANQIAGDARRGVFIKAFVEGEPWALTDLAAAMATPPSKPGPLTGKTQWEQRT